jgi:hypothetical protein
MNPLLRTNQGRLEAFNSQSKLTEDLRILLKFIDGRRTLVDLKRALKPHIFSREKIQKLIDMGLVAAFDGWMDVEIDSQMGVLSYLPTTPAALNPKYMPSTKAAFEQSTLAEAKECMGDFVLRHTPESAFLLLSEIENFKTLEQLQASLPSYEQLIKHADIYAGRHMRDLRQIIANTHRSELRQGS